MAQWDASSFVRKSLFAFTDDICDVLNDFKEKQEVRWRCKWTFTRIAAPYVAVADVSRGWRAAWSSSAGVAVAACLHTICYADEACC
jgi:hypothetical protein